MVDEVRTVNEQTGGEKGRKLARFDLVPVRPLTMLAEHYGKGAEKYEDRNWERGYDWSLNYAALMRHVTEWWNGETIDEETGSHHLAAVAWHAFALLEFAETHPELDDRPERKRNDYSTNDEIARRCILGVPGCGGRCGLTTHGERLPRLQQDRNNR